MRKVCRAAFARPGADNPLLGNDVPRFSQCFLAKRNFLGFCNSLRENPNGVAPSMLLRVAVAHVVLLPFATRRLQIASERLGQCCFMSCGSLLASRNGVAGQAARKPQSVGEVGHVWNTSSSSYGTATDQAGHHLNRRSRTLFWHKKQSYVFAPGPHTRTS